MDKGTQIRTVIMILSWVNMYLARKGMSPIPVNEEEIGLLLMIATSIWAWWKNNNITQNAVKAQQVKKKIDKGQVDVIGDKVVVEEETAIVVPEEEENGLGGGRVE